MRKAIEKRFYNKDDSMYLVMIGNTITGLFDSENNQVALVTNRFLDMGKININNEIYVVRSFKRKGMCLLFKISSNDINLDDSCVFALHGQKIDCVDLWDGIDF